MIMSIRSYDLSPGNISIMLFLIALPFMYYPKVLSGDTQPWILMALLVAFATYKIDLFIRHQDFLIIFLALCCVLVYALRNESAFAVLRNTYTFVTFVLAWVVVQRGDERLFMMAIKFTVLLWFLVGVVQFVSDKLGYHIDVSGRWHKIVKQGPPSLTAEASFYGSISVICIMYLLTDKSASRYFYIVLAFLSILISGSFLAVLLLVFPLMRLPVSFQLAGLFLLPVFIFVDYYSGGAGVSSRIEQIFSSGQGLSGMLHDPSLNLRAGHIYYTLFVNLPDSLALLNDVDFYNQYNAFAKQSGIFIATGSPFILPALGEMIYGGGIFALILFLLVLKRASDSCQKPWYKIQKAGFVAACMINPVSLSNPFLILYILKKDE
jgi:hypothetical protein